MSKIFIFLGSSLSVEEAKSILPEAYYLKPVRCGDILRILRLQPSIIGIIDGYFENTAAVWHKEILYALEQGVRIIGGGSMGALRASELQKFGVELVGKIATNYAKNILNGDDEVAVLHSLKDDVSTTDAMVNIRATLIKAKKEKIIGSIMAEKITAVAKARCYHDRNFVDIIEDLIISNNRKHELKALKLWLINGHLVDVKKEDALLVLKTILLTKNNLQKDQTFRVNKTIFFRALQRNVMCRPFTYEHPCLPIQERVAMASRFLDSNYRLIRRLGYLMSVCYGLAVQKKNTDFLSSGTILDEKIFDFYDNVNTKNWDIIHDCSGQQKINLLERVEKICNLLCQETANIHSKEIINYYVLMLMRLSGEYVKYKEFSIDEIGILNHFKNDQPLRFHLMSSFGACWWYLEKQLLCCNLNPSPHILEEHANRFRLTNKLYTQRLTEKWMVENDLNSFSFHYLIAANARLSIIVLQNNTDILGDLSGASKIWWFLDALYISGFYPEAKKLLEDSDKLAAVKRMLFEKNKSQIEQYTVGLDFIGGERDFFSFATNANRSEAND